MATEKHIIAIRHAPTRAPGVCVGRAEVSTTLTADEVARRILDAIGDSVFDGVWTSPASRCLAPAEIVAASRALPLRVDERLHEISMGAWQGKTYAQIERDDPARYHAWMSNWQTQAPPDGETPGDLLARVSAWWDGLLPGNHVLVAHAGVVHALRVHVHGMPWTDAMSRPVPHLTPESFSKNKSA